MVQVLKVRMVTVEPETEQTDPVSDANETVRPEDAESVALSPSDQTGLGSCPAEVSPVSCRASRGSIAPNFCHRWDESSWA